ncbi:MULTISPECIES: helix-turn-helix domain-containing protein [unclassified Flavobacterium]|jgi:transcriptional regulator with XRE-family HTH domain|uniref:helix-turn-helix domain-containing protein n=1 Tax=unclassified Flavobacterium TaxID=196869 RepID=UPI00131D5208|nr:MULTISPECIES: helix-turn-helix transcriptional regulator [unclassified Flavobacterium]
MKSELLIHFGERIRELRKERNWSQETLAEGTGFHRTYIGMIERGERNLSLLNIQIFAKTFKITLQELFNFYE